MKLRSALIAVTLLAGMSLPARALTPPMSLSQEAVYLLRDYLKIDTTNPPGHEMATAKFLKAILDREGIENQIFDLGDGRANLMAVLHGDGSKRPLVLLHHMDVVPADPQYWSAPPFSGELRNGVIYGRGAIDIKGKGIVDLMTLVRFKRDKTPLKRDVVFLAVADEEVSSIGSRWMIEHQAEFLKKAEYLLDEGETIHESLAGVPLYTMVGIGEKSPLWLSLNFKGQPGHASIPMADSAVNRALRAAQRILDFSEKIPFNIVPGLEESLRRQYGEDVTRLPGYSRDMSTSLRNPQFLQALAAKPVINALMRNTITITGMSGSDKINIIPNEASLKLDCRLIPGVSKETFLAELRQVIADPSVEIKVEEYYAAQYSPSDTSFFSALRNVLAKRQLKIPVIPTIFTSSTDSSLYRALGIHVYGFESTPLDEEISLTAHGNDERIKVSSVATGLEVLPDLILELNK
ncbi:MAG: M20/M25/M40 family metallo-hydrolase [Candidatus Sericytochromatia bacterium]